jgi:hypothetical protein
MQGFCESRAAWRPIASPAHPRNRRGSAPDSREPAGAFCGLSTTTLGARTGNECRASVSPAPRVVPRKLGGRSPARLILATDAGRIRSTVAAASCALRSPRCFTSTPPRPRKSGR